MAPSLGPDAQPCLPRPATCRRSSRGLGCLSDPASSSGLGGGAGGGQGRGSDLTAPGGPLNKEPDTPQCPRPRGWHTLVPVGAGTPLTTVMAGASPVPPRSGHGSRCRPRIRLPAPLDPQQPREQSAVLTAPCFTDAETGRVRVEYFAPNRRAPELQGWAWHRGRGGGGGRWFSPPRATQCRPQSRPGREQALALMPNIHVTLTSHPAALRLSFLNGSPRDPALASRGHKRAGRQQQEFIRSWRWRPESKLDVAGQPLLQARGEGPSLPRPAAVPHMSLPVAVTLHLCSPSRGLSPVYVSLVRTLVTGFRGNPG